MGAGVWSCPDPRALPSGLGLCLPSVDPPGAFPPGGHVERGCLLFGEMFAFLRGFAVGLEEAAAGLPAPSDPHIVPGLWGQWDVGGW